MDRDLALPGHGLAYRSLEERRAPSARTSLQVLLAKFLLLGRLDKRVDVESAKAAGTRTGSV